MNILDRAGSRAHSDVDAFAREQGLITQAEEKIRSAFLPGRENYVARGSGLNKMVGDNQSYKRE